MNARSGDDLTVLVVDDDPAVATLHRRFVDAHPRFTTVAVAHSGEAALTAVARAHPDLVLLDFHLPGMSGLDVLRQVRSSGTSQPEVIAVTAARDVESVTRARIAGVRHYLVKPFTASDLRERLDAVADEKSGAAAGVPDAELDQDRIDDLLAGRIRSARLPKGLSAETLARVHATVARMSEASAAEIGDAAGLSRVSSRRYLEHLVATGDVERDLDYGTAGRPRTRYRPVRPA